MNEFRFIKKDWETNDVSPRCCLPYVHVTIAPEARHFVMSCLFSFVGHYSPQRVDLGLSNLQYLLKKLNLPCFLHIVDNLEHSAKSHPQDDPVVVMMLLLKL